MGLLSRLKEQAGKLKCEAQVLLIAYKDKRTPALAKILIGITVGYLFSPIDLIPDFIPVLGILDDLLIVPSLIMLSIKLIPATVLNEARISAKNGTKNGKRKNWIAAILIMAIWLAALYFIYRFMGSIPN